MNSAIQGGQVAHDAAGVSEHHLKIMFTYVFQFGLQQWCPDILGGSPMSLYNSTYESIALESFQHVTTNFGYSFKGVNLTHLENVPLLSKLYWNFIYYTKWNKVMKEVKNGAGSVESYISKNEIYKWCKQVSCFLFIYEFKLTNQLLSLLTIILTSWSEKVVMKGWLCYLRRISATQKMSKL